MTAPPPLRRTTAPRERVDAAGRRRQSRLDAALLDVIARAASPAEREGAGEGGGFAPVPPRVPDPAGPREAEWAAAVSGGDVARLHELLAERGVSPAAARRRLRDVRVADPSRLPPWARELRGLVRAADEAEARGGAARLTLEPLALDEVAGAAAREAAGLAEGARWPLFPVFEPLLLAGWAQLHREIARAGVPVAPGAARRMLAQLAQRWSAAGAATLLHVLGPADVLAGHRGPIGVSVQAAVFGAPGGGTVVERWVALLEDYPVLGRLLAVVLANWRDAVSEMLGRLARDRGRLERALGGGPLGELAWYHADAGDAHGHGRTVTILTFAGGRRVVYKPKDLRISAAYMDVARALNDAALDPPLHLRAVVAGAGYAWEEFAVAAPCATRDEVRHFYRRMGMHARLLQLLEGSDFTADNVLPCGEHPVLIDLETLLSPRMRPDAALSDADRAAERAAGDTPCRSGIILARIVGEPGRRPANLAALAPASDRVAPFRQPVVRRRPDGTAHVEYDYLPFDGNAGAPSLGGETARAADYLDEVEAGYLAMAACLRRAAPALAAEGGPLRALAELPVRFLCRDTHIYGRMLQESLAPRRLRDGVARELWLERMWKARFDSPAIVQSEVDSLRELDIPMFTARAGDSAIVLGDGDAEVPDFFDGSALGRVLERLAALGGRSDDEERDVIRTALFTLDPARPVAAAAPVERAAAPVWLDEAVAAGDALLGWRLPAAGGAAAWLGLKYHPWTDAWDLGALGADLLTGSAGLAVALAELARASGLTRFADAAREIAGGLVRRLERAPEELAARPRGAAYARTRPYDCGLTGAGAWLYAAHRVAAALGEPALRDAAAAAASALDPELLCEQAPADVVAGRAGLLLAAVAVLRAGTGESPALAALADRLAAGLAAERGAGGEWPRPAYPAGAAFLQALPGTNDGAALALRRWELWRGRASAGPANAAAPAPAGAGDAVARLALARDGARCLTSAIAESDALLAAGSLGALDAACVALAAHRASGGRGSHLERASAAGAELAARRRAGGGSAAADRFDLSAVGGVAAVVHLFLDLHQPGLLPAIRTMD